MRAVGGNIKTKPRHRIGVADRNCLPRDLAVRPVVGKRGVKYQRVGNAEGGIFVKVGRVVLFQFEQNRQSRRPDVLRFHFFHQEMRNRGVVAKRDEGPEISRRLEQVARVSAEFDPLVEIEPILKIRLRKSGRAIFPVNQCKLLLQIVGRNRLLLECRIVDPTIFFGHPRSTPGVVPGPGVAGKSDRTPVGTRGRATGCRAQKEYRARLTLKQVAKNSAGGQHGGTAPLKGKPAESLQVDHLQAHVVAALQLHQFARE